MARNYRSIFITAFLCIVILFITGVSFPKYIVSQNLQKSELFNSSTASFKLSSNELFASNQVSVGNLTNSSSLASKGEETESSSRGLPTSTASNRLQSLAKGKRFKRQTTSQDDSSEALSWNFNLSVSHLESTALHKVDKNNSGVSDGKQLGLAFYAKSRGPQEVAFSELQKTLDSVSSYLKKLFSSDSEYGTNGFNGRNKVEIKHLDKLDIADTQNLNIGSSEKVAKQLETVSEIETASFNEVSPISELKPTQILSTQKPDGGSKNESVKRGREGKIFFSFFEFGGKLLGKTSPVLETESTKSSMDITQTERNILQDENLPHVPQHKSGWITEHSNQETSFHSDPLESSVDHLVKDLPTDHNTQNLQFEQTTQLLECSGCITGSLGFPVLPNKVEEKSEDVILETTDSVEILFTDDILEHFCKSLLDGSHLSLLENKETQTDAMTENSLVDIEDGIAEFSLQTDKQRFFNVFDRGSGRSDIASEEKDLASFEQVDENIDEVRKFPSVLDCLQFFNKERNTNALFKPNDPENIFPNFENSSEAPNSQEQQLQFSSSLNNFQTLDEISVSTETDLGKSKPSVGNENSSLIKDLSVKQEDIKTELSDFIQGNKSERLKNTDAGNGSEKTSDDRRDGKLLSFFGFGSGSSPEENISVSERFFNSFFGSGARSIENSDGLEESGGIVDVDSGDSFLSIEGFSGDDAMLLVSNSGPSENINTTSGQEHSFLSLLGFAGSGNGRELTEDTELVVTEVSDDFDNECDNCSRSIKPHKCDDYDCNLGNIHDLETIDSTESETLIPFNESDCHQDCYPNIELLNSVKNISTNESSNVGKNMTGYFHEISENCNCFNVNNFTGGNVDFPDCDCNLYSFQESDVPYIGPGNFSAETHLSKNPTEVNDEYENCYDCNDERFPEGNKVSTTAPLAETSELTFKNNTDAVQEIENPLHSNEVNSTDFNFEMQSVESTNTVESLHDGQKTTVMKPRRFVGTIFLTGSGDGGLFGDNDDPINLVEEERTINPVVHLQRRGRLDDLPADPCDDCGDLSELIQENSLERQRTSQTADHFSSSSTINFDDNALASITRPTGEAILKEGVTSVKSVTFWPEIISNGPSSFSPNTPPHFQSRPCLGARDCNATLGERCITLDSSSVCECGRTFVRQKLTGKCVAKRYVETALKLPEEPFDSDLRNPQSPRYKIMSEKSVDTMWLLLGETPDIQHIVTEVNVAKFTAGSLIISLNLVIAVEKESEAESVKGMEDKLQKALGNENLMKRASLNIKNATVLSVTRELDPCKSAELNYCSKNAYCETMAGDPGYTCNCKEHFLDVSSDPFFPGEKCIDNCPPSYCGANGHCEILGNERHCLCNGMYFGERCELPGMIILGSLTITAIFTLGIICCVLIKIRCRRTSYGGSPTFRRSEEIGPHSIANCRVSDAIALTENPGVSKFAQICTPVPVPPTIKVTHPTFNDSNISFECDSSFDASYST